MGQKSFQGIFQGSLSWKMNNITFLRIRLFNGRCPVADAKKAKKKISSGLLLKHENPQIFYEPSRAQSNEEESIFVEAAGQLQS